MDKNNPIPLNEQILAFGKLIGQITNTLQPMRASISPTSLESLAHMEAALSQLAQQAALFTEERDNLLALADISATVNSSLELDDVLRIVMDTIVRLTGPSAAS